MRATAILALLLLAPVLAAADPIVLTDPAGDGHGPGTYRYPGGPLLTEGALDLASVTLEESGDHVAIEVRFHHRIRTATARLAEDERREVFAQQVDIYIDQDRLPDSGATTGIPGRNIAMPDGMGWERAIVLTSVPDRVSSSLDGRDDVAMVIVPFDVQVRGRTLTARVRKDLLGGAPSPDWGYAVAVSSVTFANSLAATVDRDSSAYSNVYTREITWKPGSCSGWEETYDGSPCTFGGCDPCGGHPRVMDALDSRDATSAALLAGYSGPEQRLARIPVVVPSGMPLKRPPQVAEPEQALGQPAGGSAVIVEVIDLDGDLITARAPQPGVGNPVEPGRIVDILDARSQPMGRAVVVKVLDGLLVLRAVDPPSTAAEAPPVKAVRLR